MQHTLESLTDVTSTDHVTSHVTIVLCSLLIDHVLLDLLLHD